MKKLLHDCLTLLYKVREKKFLASELHVVAYDADDNSILENVLKWDEAGFEEELAKIEAEIHAYLQKRKDDASHEG